jgi:hypothetical protein
MKRLSNKAGQRETNDKKRPTLDLGHGIKKMQEEGDFCGERIQ